MPVYMIRAGEHGPVKIGHSFDPQFRLGQLQISHWETLRIIRLFEGAEIEEAALHQKFADQRHSWRMASLLASDAGQRRVGRDYSGADCVRGCRTARSGFHQRRRLCHGCENLCPPESASD